jgi:hypothetical protein
MCDCINKTLESLRNMHPEAYFVNMELINIHSIDEPTIRKTGQKYTASSQRVNRKGRKVESNYSSFVSHNFCPWCGVSYTPKTINQ